MIRVLGGDGSVVRVLSAETHPALGPNRETMRWAREARYVRPGERARIVRAPDRVTVKVKGGNAVTVERL